ncbi:MAG: hypothetical protein IPK60_20125 [Sandaracinaceae bacterium]|nr:hypothetical protein [Sandaracinaceae bacterium]
MSTTAASSETTFEKTYFDRTFRFAKLDPAHDVVDARRLKELGADSVSVSVADPTCTNIEDVDLLKGVSGIRALRLNAYSYKSVAGMSACTSLEYLSFTGVSNGAVPFAACTALWCAYLNYDPKTCEAIFEAKTLEHAFVDNYVGKSSKPFESFRNARRLGLMKNRLAELDAVQAMPKLEHLGFGYNSTMKSIGWLSHHASLSSVGFNNCKNISDWNVLATLSNLEVVLLESCGEIATLDFIHQLPRVKELRLVGNTRVKDARIASLLKHPTLKHIFVPVRKDYDVTLSELTAFNQALR